MVDDSPVQKNRRKVPIKPIDEDEIEVDQEEHKNEDDVKDHSKSINHIRQSEWNLMIFLETYSVYSILKSYPYLSRIFIELY